MTIRYAILGFLSWRPFTGYDLKKKFAESGYFHWSGNNNQIYTTLAQLHRERLVSSQVQDQERGPSRKIYAITDQGQSELRKWILSPPELPESRNAFLVQLAWGDQLDHDELETLLAGYEHQIAMQLLIFREKERRGTDHPTRTPREACLWRAIAENWAMIQDGELAWVRGLRRQLADLQEATPETGTEEKGAPR